MTPGAGVRRRRDGRWCWPGRRLEEKITVIATRAARPRIEVSDGARRPRLGLARTRVMGRQIFKMPPKFNLFFNILFKILILLKYPPILLILS